MPIDPVADLSTRLIREQAMAMPRIRTCVRAWWSDHGFAEIPTAVGKRVAVALIEQPRDADKLAGVVVLQELGPHLRAADLPAFARLFATGHLADWQIVDAFAMRVLATLLDRVPGRRDVARAYAAWRASESMWQRRAACLAFVKLAPQGDAALAGLTDHVLALCTTTVWSHEPADQTAVGLVLRELGLAEPARVAGFFRRYAMLMSKACARQAAAKLPAPLKAELLAHHRRATSL